MFAKFLPKKVRRRIEALESELENYRVLVANTPDLLYRTDLEGRILFVSPSVKTLSGYTVGEAIGMEMAEEVYLHKKDRTHFLELLQKEGHVRNFQAQLKRKDGSIWWASTNAHFYRDKKGNICGVEGITRNIDELKKAEKAQQKSEELFRLTFHTSPDSINLNRAADGMYIDINEGFTKLSGYSRKDVIGKTSVSLNIWHNQEDREKLIKGLEKKGYVENLEAEFIDKKGKVHIGLMSARLLQLHGEQVILSVTRDITDRIQMELQLQQAQKYEALGTLAGGIAHDFNNLLMGIQGRASLLGVNLPPEDPSIEHVQSIEDYVRSATHLTNQILGFARGGKYETAPVNINELLKKSITLFSRTSKELSLHLHLHSEPVTAEVDQRQFEQAFLNIFVNAKQAMPEGGDIFLETSTINLSEEFCALHKVAPGWYGKISITDTGSGMNEDTRRRAFDPFFTTKEKGRGTGLGLASVLGIIKNHAGAITLTSQINLGTTVDIYLPLTQLKPPLQTLQPKDELKKGAETILLVDDELLVTNVGKAMLERLGYKVYVANSGLEATEILNNQEKKVDLVVLDLIMPKMDGKQTFSAIRKLQPQLPVLLSSGYSIDGQAQEILNNGCNGFIQKPFNLSELSRKVRDILDN